MEESEEPSLLGRWDPLGLFSEEYFCRYLNLTRTVDLARNFAESTRTHTRIRRTERRRIEKVERLRVHFEFESLDVKRLE